MTGAARLVLALVAAGVMASAANGRPAHDEWDADDTAEGVRYTADLVARTCPPKAWVDAVNRQFPSGITFDYDPDPLAPGGCPGGGSLPALTRLQAKVYQSLHLMRRYLAFDAPLPWTRLPLWEWFRQSVLGIVFTAEPHSWCCDASGRIHVAVDEGSSLLAPWGDTFMDAEGNEGLHDFIGLLVHEARHANGIQHGCGEATDDTTLGEMGAWAVERYLFAWWADHTISPSFWAPGTDGLAPDLYLVALRRHGDALCRVGGRFCEDACPGRPFVAPGDYDGDGRADAAVYRYANQTWYVSGTALGPITSRMGRLGDVPVAADYDGDSLRDFAVYRPAGSWWLVSLSGGGRLEKVLGAAGDVPVPADYDGDGRTDIAVWRPSDGSWHIEQSTDGTLTTFAWGRGDWTGWIAVPADYDGDGKSEPAAFDPRSGTWRLGGGKDGEPPLARRFGRNGDVPVPGDYDGDGTVDLGVWRPADASFHIVRPGVGEEAIALGGPGDIPLAGRFDLDLADDVAVFSPAVGTWTIRYSAGSPALTTTRWGRAGDVPQ
ncbi:MAG: FG-GAP repeat domain-containing protein [Vicinamibacterales bacterium]